MKISCTICTELMAINEDLKVTKCGHLFHLSCLSDWLLRSQSCPQCRCMVTNDSTFQVYPTLSDEATDMETIQSNLDEALQKVQELHSASEEKENRLRTVTEDLNKNEEILKQYSSELDSLNSIVEILKEQLDTLEMLKERLEIEKSDANQEILCLKEDMKHLEEEISSLKADNQLSQELTQKLEQETHHLKKEIQILMNENHPTKQLTDQLEVGIRRLEEELLRLEPESKKLQEENTLHREEIQHLKNGIKSLFEKSQLLGEARKPEEEAKQVKEVSTVIQSSENEIQDFTTKEFSIENSLVGKDWKQLEAEMQRLKEDMKILKDETQRLKINKENSTQISEEEKCNIATISLEEELDIRDRHLELDDKAKFIKEDIQISQEKPCCSTNKQCFEVEKYLNDKTQQNNGQLPEVDPLHLKEMLLDGQVDRLENKKQRQEDNQFKTSEELILMDESGSVEKEEKCLKNETENLKDVIQLSEEETAARMDQRQQEEIIELMKEETQCFEEDIQITPQRTPLLVEELEELIF